MSTKLAHLCAVMALLALFGCAHGKVQLPFTGLDCTGQDWFEIGRQDGAIGVSEENFAARTKECTKIERPEAQENYRLGHASGMSEYCSAESGFALGRNGMDYTKICPEQLNPELLRGYHKGLQASFLDMAIQRLDQQIEASQMRLSSQNLNDLQRSYLKNQTAQLLKQKAQNELDLEKLKSEL